MRTIVTGLAMLAVAVGAIAFAQSPSFAEVCDTQEIPTRAEYESNATAYADHFCALATYAPHRAARQFNSMVALVRSHNNPNRFYWDPREEPHSRYIQLLRPWMAEQGYVLRWLDPELELSDDEGLFLQRDHLAVVRYEDSFYDETPRITLAIQRQGVLYGRTSFSSTYHAYLLWGDGKGAYVERIPDDNPDLMRVTLNRQRVRIANAMNSQEMTSAVHAALDCLEDPVVFDSDGADCNAIVKRCEHCPPGTFGSYGANAPVNGREPSR